MHLPIYFDWLLLVTLQNYNILLLCEIVEYVKKENMLYISNIQ